MLKGRCSRMNPKQQHEDPATVYEKVLRGEATPADYAAAVREHVAERHKPEHMRREAVIAKVETSKPPERAARHGLRDIWRAINNAIVPPISRKRS
jgi:hypothetical protein